jgi:uncharacterized protein YcnI
MSIAFTRSGSLRALRRAIILGVATTGAVLLFAGPALAHITISPSSVPAGSTVVLTLHVPNEETNADTVKLDVQIPTAHPIAQLLVQPVPGWSVSVRSIRLAKPLVTGDGSFSQAVSEVIWSGGKILPGQFQDFSISADPMPVGISQLPLKAIQTYSNGDIVRWIDLPQPGLPAPAHPAPVITLTTGTATTPARTAGHATAAAPAASGSDGLTRALAVAGLLVGLLACLLSLMFARQARRLTAVIGPVAGTTAATDQPDTANGQAPADAKIPAPSGAKATVPAGAKASARRDQAPAGGKPPARRPQQRRRG